MNFWSFFKQSLLVLLVSVLVSVAILSLWNNAAYDQAAWTGLAIGYGNALLGYAIINWGYHKSQNAFLASVFGGIIFRFLLIFALLFILIGALDMNRVALVVPLVATYFLFMTLEIFHIHKSSQVERNRE